MDERKEYLKGFTGARIWKVDKNSTAEYALGPMIDLPGAQNLTKSVAGEEFTIRADDIIWDTGVEYSYEDLTFTIVQLTPELEALLSGGEFDEVNKIYHFKNIDAAPEFAFGYAALKANKTYRMYKHFAMRLQSIALDHATRGASTDAQAYQLTFRNTQRNVDGMVRDTKDSDGASYTWLNTIDPISATTPDP